MTNPLAVMHAYFQRDILNIIKQTASPLPQWNPADPAGSLDALYQYGEAHADAAVSWYYGKKQGKSRLSMILRYSTIFAMALAGLIPVMVALLPQPAATDAQVQTLRMQQWGYLSVGLAALFLALDRFSGASTGWMRYITTGMAIETAREQFRFDWIRLVAGMNGPPKTPDDAQTLIQRVTDFVTVVRGLVEKETQAWVSEFQANLNQLDKDTQALVVTAKAQVEEMKKAVAAKEQAARPGIIGITVDNVADTDHGYVVELDGQPTGKVIDSRTCSLRDVPPGLHDVTVTATMNGERARTSQPVRVESDAILNVKFTLEKVKKPGT